MRTQTSLKPRESRGNGALHMRNRRQRIFREMVLGTLVYSVVLGFFADYTELIDVGTQSTLFAAAFVLQVLTYLTLELKSKVASRIKLRKSRFSKPLLGFSIWFILFSSKFVFLWVIDVIFGSAVQISGFVSLMAIIVVMTIVKELIDYTYQKLADS